MSQPFYNLALGAEPRPKLLPPGKGSNWNLRLLTGGMFGTAPLAGWWPLLTVSCVPPLGDLFEFTSMKAVSERFRRLCDGFQVNAEFLPVNVERRNGAPASNLPYWILHPLERIDCIDYAASDYDIYGTKDNFSVARFRRLVMRPEVIGDRDLFRPDRYTALYVSQKLRDAILGARLTVGFRQLEGDWET
jgi:hypothetical protein